MDDLTSTENSGKGSPCSIQYLRCIKFNLLAIAMFFPHAYYDEPIALESYLDYTYPELERLHEHPELFPSKNMEENFHYDVSIICDLLLNVAIPNGDDALASEMDLDRALGERTSEILCPARDERRKPWQQYLHNNAPGSGIHPSRMTHRLAIPGMKTTQAVPLSVAKFLEGFKQDREAILREFGLVSFAPMMHTSREVTLLTIGRRMMFDHG